MILVVIFQSIVDYLLGPINYAFAEHFESHVERIVSSVQYLSDCCQRFHALYFSVTELGVRLLNLPPMHLLQLVERASWSNHLLTYFSHVPSDGFYRNVLSSKLCLVQPCLLKIPFPKLQPGTWAFLLCDAFSLAWRSVLVFLNKLKLAFNVWYQLERFGRKIRRRTMIILTHRYLQQLLLGPRARRDLPLASLLFYWQLSLQLKSDSDNGGLPPSALAPLRPLVAEDIYYASDCIY